ncbi:hypothetical protein EU805_04020 [Salipiger sp. IMCC34102]|uniref:hypothetical protein n=1 Tax=Salipiger sp. IMCC34102 TaxID=2510647 RepID=UPI00101CE234|nr:hypothetical protein [Salipiger sp. IMCC34102]RYH04532.1 hypothetical protein EU805_04020 [Salipiger sp. IMCC34102]
MSENELNHDEFGTGVGTLMWITLAPWIWAFHFTICYGLTAILCEKAIPDGDVGTLRLVLVAVTVIALAGIAAAGLSGWRNWTEGGLLDKRGETGLGDLASRNRFLGQVSVFLAVVSFIGVVFVILPILMFGSCR